VNGVCACVQPLVYHPDEKKCVECTFELEHCRSCLVFDSCDACEDLYAVVEGKCQKCEDRCLYWFEGGDCMKCKDGYRPVDGKCEVKEHN
jgi:hypothetical protein